jgi:hypothetical protein
VDSDTHPYPQAYWGSKALVGGPNQRPVDDALTQGVEPRWHQYSFYGCHPRRWIATVEYLNPGFEYNVDFRNWTVIYDGTHGMAVIHATMSKWAEADWHLHVSSANDNQRVTSADGTQVYPSNKPKDTIKFGGRIGNDYNQVQDWGFYGAATVTFNN